jgi:capsular exopolysaccharide synthesis family protein
MPRLDAEFAELTPDSTVAPQQGVGINVSRLLKLRGKLMALVLLAIFVPALLYALLVVPRHFVAEARIEYASTPKSIMRAERGFTGNTYEIFVNTEIDFLKSPAFMSRVIKNEQLIQSHPELIRRSDALYTLLTQTDVAIVRATQVVMMTYLDVDRERALAVMGAMLAEYKKVLRERSEMVGSTSRTAISQSIQVLNEQIGEMRTRVNNLRSEEKLPAGTQPGTDTVEAESVRINLTQAEGDLTRTENAVVQARQLRERAEALLEQYRQNPAQSIFALGVERSVTEHPSVTFLEEQMAQAMQDFAVVEDRYVDGAPQLRVAQREIKLLEERLAAQRATVRGDILRSLAAQYEYDIDAAEHEAVEARQRRDRFMNLLTEEKDKALSRTGAFDEIMALEADLGNRQNQLQLLKDELLTLDIEEQAPAQVIPAEEPWAASSPDYSARIKAAMIGLFLALMAAIGLGVGLELTDQNIRSGDDIKYVSKLPVLAGVPHMDEDRLPAEARPATVSGDYADSMTADEYRRAAARVLAPGAGGPELRSCLVVGPSRGEGRTTVACNLAIVLAQADRRVLLVDLDSHNPKVETSFGLQAGVGLAELLSGEHLPHDPDQATAYDNLYVIGPGLNTRELLSRLASREMTDFLAGAEEVFDHVIIDTPASLLMAEARLLAPKVDGVLVVVGAGVSTFGMLRRTIRSIEESGGRIMGILLNQLRQSPFGYLRRNTRQYYDERHGHPRHTVAPRTQSARAKHRAPASVMLTRGDDDR